MLLVSHCLFLLWIESKLKIMKEWCFLRGKKMMWASKTHWLWKEKLPNPWGNHAVTGSYQQVAAQQQLSNCLINSFLVVFNVILFLPHVVKCCCDLFSECDRCFFPQWWFSSCAAASVQRFFCVYFWILNFWISEVCAHADIYIYAVCMTAWSLMHADSCSVDSVVSKYHKTFMKEDFDLEPSVQIYCNFDHIRKC